MGVRYTGINTTLIILKLICPRNIGTEIAKRVLEIYTKKKLNGIA